MPKNTYNAVPRAGLEPGPPDPESSTLTIRPPRLPHNTVNCLLKALGLYNFITGLGLAYKRRGLNPRGGGRGGGGELISGIKKK